MIKVVVVMEDKRASVTFLKSLQVSGTLPEGWREHRSSKRFSFRLSTICRQHAAQRHAVIFKPSVFIPLTIFSQTRSTWLCLPSPWICLSDSPCLLGCVDGDRRQWRAGRCVPLNYHPHTYTQTRTHTHTHTQSRPLLCWEGCHYHIKASLRETWQRFNLSN